MSFFNQLFELLLNADRKLLLFINGLNTPFFDDLMFLASSKLIWAPLYAVLLLLLWYSMRSRFWYIIPIIILLVIATDQVSVVLFKNMFQRLRPCHDPALEGLVRTLHDKCGGLYGFISSHACNTFGVATFSGLLLKHKYRLAMPLLLLWASFVSYSRVYLGVHFPGDIIAGALVGSLIGWVMVQLLDFVVRKSRKVKEA